MLIVAPKSSLRACILSYVWPRQTNVMVSCAAHVPYVRIWRNMLAQGVFIHTCWSRVSCKLYLLDEAWRNRSCNRRRWRRTMGRWWHYCWIWCLQWYCNGEAEEEVGAEDEPADDLGQAIHDAQRECKSEKEKIKFERMLEDHKKLLYPTCDVGQKKLGTTLELLQWKAKNGVFDKGFGELLKIQKKMLPKDN